MNITHIFRKSIPTVLKIFSERLLIITHKIPIVCKTSYYVPCDFKITDYSWSRHEYACDYSLVQVQVNLDDWHGVCCHGIGIYTYVCGRVPAANAPGCTAV